MAQFTQLFISGGFASGVTYYEDFYPDEEQSARLVLTIAIERSINIQTIVDTGAPWCILDPNLIIQPETVHTGYEPEIKLMIRGILYSGKLIRVRIGLRDEYGENDLEVDATVFVPTLQPGEKWPHPNFIGLDGFLNRIRFAVDPAENALYFGPV